MTKRVFKLIDGTVFSVESNSDTVPDTTADAGPDTIKLHEDAQKPESDSNAEYDASEHVDVPEDVEKANESSFFGVILKRRSVEAFAKTKGVFPSAEGFFKSNECKQAIAVAKQWAEKKKMSPAATNDVPENLKKLGFSAKSMTGLTLAYREAKGRLYVDVLFKNAKGKVISKNFATVKIGSGQTEKKDKAGESKSAVDKVLTKENGDPVDEAFAATAEPPATPPATEPPPATTEPPTDAATSPATEPTTTEPDAPEVTPDEIDEEISKGAESYIMAVSRAIRSREEADAAVSTISDNEIDEVVGDTEGSDVEAVPVPSEEAPPAGTTAEDEASKALEAYLEAFNI